MAGVVSRYGGGWRRLEETVDVAHEAIRSIPKLPPTPHARPHLTHRPNLVHSFLVQHFPTLPARCFFIVLPLPWTPSRGRMLDERATNKQATAPLLDDVARAFLQLSFVSGHVTRLPC